MHGQTLQSCTHVTKQTQRKSWHSSNTVVYKLVQYLSLSDLIYIALIIQQC